jgi:tRNA-dihydrouridine synthase
MNFWNELKQPFFCLAPMEDVTNTIFRRVVVRAARPEVFFTEFMNVDGFCHPTGRQSVARRLQFFPTERPIVAQIWGSKPQNFSLTATELGNFGFAGVDINMGCPDKSVVKSGGGAALIKNPELAVEIIRAVKSAAGTGPISVKTRLGFSKIDEWQPWLISLLGQNLAALTIHLRTRKEMSKVPAHYELIPDIIKLRDAVAPKTILIINGDIKSIPQGQSLWGENRGINGFMIGRGIFANPFCFEKNPRPHSRSELIDLLKYHLELFDKSGCQKYEPLKKFFKIYINGFSGAKELRNKLMATIDTTQLYNILEDL